MSKADNYILVTWWWDDMGDHEPTFQTSFDFVKDSQLKDMSKFMERYGIKQWVTDPQNVTKDTYKHGDGALIEFRNVTVQAVKVVEAWSYKAEQVSR